MCRLFQTIKHGPGGAVGGRVPRFAAKDRGDGGQISGKAIAGLCAIEEAESLVGQGCRVGVVLDELPDDRPIRQNIDHAEIGDADDTDSDLIGKGRHLVDKGVGEAEAGGLQCGRSGADKACGGAPHEIA